MLVVLMIVGILIFPPGSVNAEPEAGKLIKSGTVELGIQAGYWQATTALGGAQSSNRSAVFVLPQIGYVLTDKLDAGYFSGAFEVIVEPVGAHFFEPFSASLFGGSLVLKYDFLSYGRWIPYWDVGAGMVWTDLASRIPEQSTQFNFILGTGPGVQYLVTDRTAVSLGVRLSHISNANLGDRNTGINAVLGLIGFAYYFPD